MKKYKISIEETIVDTFEVEANTHEEAIEIAIKNYKTGEFVLAPGHLVAKQMAVEKPNGETEWFDF